VGEFIRIGGLVSLEPSAAIGNAVIRSVFNGSRERV
jgi:hypothetical protein